MKRSKRTLSSGHIERIASSPMQPVTAEERRRAVTARIGNLCPNIRTRQLRPKSDAASISEAESGSAGQTAALHLRDAENIASDRDGPAEGTNTYDRAPPVE
jgi:hypothetical protein